MKAIAVFVVGLATAGGIAANSYAADLATDKAYCEQLIQIYTKGGMSRGGSGPQSLDLSVAIAQCRSDNPQAAIPVLQQRLSDAGFTVPPRP